MKKLTIGIMNFDEVNYLTGLGLIELKRTKDGREKAPPMVDYERMLLAIPVR